MSSLTYLQFHAAFLLMALLALVPLVTVMRHRAAGPTVWSREGGDRYWFGVALIGVIALVYTVPWDNYLIAKGVWGYGDGRVLLRIWNAPLEEYLFIAVQPLLTGLWLSQLTVPAAWPETDRLALTPRAAAGALAVAIGLLGAFFLTADATFYLGAILAWGAPVLLLQWVVGAPQLVAAWRTVLIGTLGPTVYLCLADWIAIRSGVWFLSERFTTGITVLGLPVEEATFFLVTNLFVVQGLVLYRWLHDRHGGRLLGVVGAVGGPGSGSGHSAGGED
jgi:lycopene cyclase domain-containing protein